MSQIIRVKINVSKIVKEALFDGKSGKLLDITLLPNRNGTDKYGNDFMVVQDLGKDARLRGEKGPILGNAQFVGGSAQRQPPASQSEPVGTPAPEGSDSDVPF
jgi:hypothetical protein